MKAELEQVEADLDALETYAEGIPAEAQGFQQRIQTALLEFQAKLDSLGRTN